MEITTERIEPGLERIKVQIKTTDYEQDFKKELSKAAKESNYKGFRQGKVPMGFILRTQGQSILYNLIFKKINESLSEHLEKENVDYLFDPLPAEDQQSYDFNPSKKEDFTFLFDLCLAPDLNDIAGWGSDNSYKDFQLEVGEEPITERINEFRKAHGKLVEKEDISDDDRTGVKFELTVPAFNNKSELELNIKFLLEELTNDFRNKLIGAKPGDEFFGDFGSFLKEESHAHLIKAYSEAAAETEDGSEQAGDEFKGLEIKWVVDEVTVFEEAEVNEEFLKKVSGSGEQIVDEKELREKISKMLESEYWGVSRSIILKHLRQRVVENNELSLPDRFLKEFVLRDIGDQEITDEVRKATLWSVFSTSLARKKGIKVTEEEVRSFLANQVINWLRGVQDQQLIMGMVDRMMEDKAAKDNATENIFVNKLAGVVYDGVDREVVKLKKEEFDKLIDEEFPPSDESEEE